MSDEYASSGYKGSLVNETMNEAPRKQVSASGDKEQGVKQEGKSNYETHNYPPPGDSLIILTHVGIVFEATSEGGYGSAANVWSGRAQRGNKTGTGTYSAGSESEGLTNQGKDGEPLRDQYDA
ncbi:hypothetical protein C0991_007338 [Blastosporella zonata]|nr:hypothetical protein C0991_007338 [Blastosporella zonata]